MEKFVRLRNMVSKASNKEVANQFIINYDGIEWFQSYGSIIGKWEGQDIYLDEYYWDYAPTTSKYRNQWLGLDSGEVRKEIAAGRIKLVNLNP